MFTQPMNIPKETEYFLPGWYYWDLDFELHGPFQSEEEALSNKENPSY